MKKGVYEIFKLLNISYKETMKEQIAKMKETALAEISKAQDITELNT